MKSEIFSKLKDYNSELEKILETKDFSKDAKNLLLSMFYKIEISYNDYATVKRRVKTKQDYLNGLMQNIKECKSIELVLPNTKEFEEFKEKNILYETDFFNKKIKVFANEIELLYAILELNDFKIYLKEEYNLIRNAFPYLLNLSNDMNNVEVLRDFNAWSWNTVKKDIIDININLIYENLKILLNFDIIQEVEKNPLIEDILLIINENMTDLYGQKYTEKVLNLIFKISIMIYINKSEMERERLSNEKELLKEELDLVKNKKIYIEKITNEKKDLINEVGKIDIILNDEKLLVSEFTKRNNELPENKKIFSISNLEEKLRREKNQYLRKIDTCNYHLQPNHYIEYKKRLQKDFAILKDIDFHQENKQKRYNYIYQLQGVFIRLLYIKLEKIKEKQELIDLFYEIRYYSFLPYNEDILVKEKEGINTALTNLEQEIIKKLYAFKMINTMSTNEKVDINIVRNIFDLKTISLESIYMELIKKNENYVLNIYEDKETPERSIDLDISFNQKDKIRLNKKVKLFI